MTSSPKTPHGSMGCLPTSAMKAATPPASPTVLDQPIPINGGLHEEAPQPPKKKSSALDLAAIMKRLESGQSTLFEESTRAKLRPNMPLRNALRAHLGGKPQYERMIKRAMEARACQNVPI